MLEIATATEQAKRHVTRRALREAWPYREVPHPGRPRRLYPVQSLPPDICAALEPGADAVSTPVNAPSSAVEALEPIDAMSKSVPPEEGARQRRFERLPNAGRARALAKLLRRADEAVECLVSATAEGRVTTGSARGECPAAELAGRRIGRGR